MGVFWLERLGMAEEWKIGLARRGLYFRFPWNVKDIL